MVKNGRLKRKDIRTKAKTEPKVKAKDKIVKAKSLMRQKQRYRDKINARFTHLNDTAKLLFLNKGKARNNASPPK